MFLAPPEPVYDDLLLVLQRLTHLEANKGTLQDAPREEKDEDSAAAHSVRHSLLGQV